MRAFCAILLMGIVTYVHVDGSHYCDPFAINFEAEEGRHTQTENRSDRDDSNNEYLKLSDFIKDPALSFYLSYATPSTVEGANDFCSAPTHGKKCAGVEHVRRLFGEYMHKRRAKLMSVTFNTTFIGYDIDDKRAFQFEMTIEVVDQDDYIFQKVEGTNITAKELAEDGTVLKENVEIPETILNILSSEFALHSIKGGYTYVTCEGSYAWTSHLHGMEPGAELTDIHNKLIDLVKRRRDGKVIEINAINKTMTPQLTKIITDLAASAA